MSLIPHTFFPRSFMDMNTWSYPFSSLSPFSSSSMVLPSMLDVFDPFDELDRMMSQDMNWINQPQMSSSFMPSLAPSQPLRNRFYIDAKGFKPESIKTELKEVDGQQQLSVWALEESGTPDSNDFERKEFKKNIMLPENAQHDKLVSFMAPDGQFVIDVPLTPPAAPPASVSAADSFAAFLPRIVDEPGGTGGKIVQLQLNIPANVDPNKVQVSVKGQDLMVKMADKSETADSVTRTHIYNRTRLPANTNFGQLYCTHKDNVLSIQAPLNVNAAVTGARNIPIKSAAASSQPSIQPQEKQPEQ